MLVTDAGIVILVSEEHPRKAPSPISVRLFGRMTLVREEQLQKTLSSILITPSGMEKVVSFPHPQKAHLSMFFTLAGMVIFEREKQP